MALTFHFSFGCLTFPTFLVEFWNSTMICNIEVYFKTEYKSQITDENAI